VIVRHITRVNARYSESRLLGQRRMGMLPLQTCGALGTLCFAHVFLYEEKDSPFPFEAGRSG
jgi:hypothetical protein